MMSEEAASSIDANNIGNEATQLSNTHEERDMNNLNVTSSSNCVTLIDSVNVASKMSNRIDMKVNNQNNLDACSDEEDWDNGVNVIVEDISPLPSCVNDSNKRVSNQTTKGEEPKKKTSVNYYVVSNENTAEPFETPEIVEDVASLDTYRDSIIEATDDSDSSDSESSSTVSEDDDDIDDNDSDNNFIGRKNLSNNKLIKTTLTKGELSIQDLPPIEDLNISVEETKCKEIGTISSIVDTQVVVQSLPNTPALDLDTILFLDSGQRPLGKIFDVLGNIHGPFYTVRFNSEDHIREKNITKHQTVYFVPESEYTSYVDTEELLKHKGSDASWQHNNEPPAACLDYSDDEGEARAKRIPVIVGAKRDNPSDNDSFVKEMNQKNLELTAKRKKEDEAKQKRVPLVRRMVSNTKSTNEMATSNSPVYPHYADGYKLKGNRSFSSADQATASRLVNFHHNAGSSPMNKFDPVSRFLVGGYSSPSNYAFPPQHFMCSSPRQLPNVVPTAQNYLTMYSRPSIQPTNAMQPPPPPPPPFSSYNTANMATIPPNYPTQPGMHPMQPSMHGPIPPQFSNFNPLSAAPLPASLPQPYFSCADSPSVPQPTFIPLNVRPGISAAAFHQFVLPPPPPPSTAQSIQHHTHPREVALPRPDRRNPPHSRSNASYYPHSPYNS